MSTPAVHLPGENLDLARMPGHWMLARLGKRVLRPGGIELTRQLLNALEIGPADDVVEFAPGLGETARLALRYRPANYTAIEQDERAAAHVRDLLGAGAGRCLVGSAENSGLPDACASIAYGEAMLTMQGPEQKARIVREAFRILRPGGRFGLHELALAPEEIADATKKEIQHALAETIRVGARPLTRVEWVEVLQSAGFRFMRIATEPMHLLEPHRLVADEGFFRALRFFINVVRTPAARHRVLSMRKVFRRYEANLRAVMLVVVKPPTTDSHV